MTDLPYQDVPIVQFDRGRVPDLLSFLTDLDMRSAVIGVEAPEQLQLDDTGTTLQDSRTMAKPAFMNVCAIASSGLMSLVNDLIGRSVRSQYMPEAACSVHEALLVYNLVVKRRFVARLSNYEILVDEGKKIIEGFTSVGYRRLPNLEFYENILETLPDFEHPTVVDSASLHGRRLHVYANSELTFTPLPSDDYSLSYVFANSESGDSPLRVVPALVRKFDGTRMLLHLWGRRAGWHTGTKFFERMRQMFLSLADTAEHMPQIIDRLHDVATQSLGFKGNDDDSDEALFERIVMAVQRRAGIAHIQAKRIVLRALMHGSADKELQTDMGYAKRHLWKIRTVYDLICACMREAIKYIPGVQYRLERTAGEILNGKIKFLNNKDR